jgi:lactate dehydrogenase-like 2-hydroxyacid dehydrogenase
MGIEDRPVGYRLGDGDPERDPDLDRAGTRVSADYDAIVVGLGGIGSATAYRLAAGGGRRVLGLEQF